MDVGLDVVHINFSAPNGCHKGYHGGELEVVHHICHLVVPKGKFPVLEPPLQQLAPLRGLAAQFCVKLNLDLAAGLGGDNVAQPVRVGFLALAAHYLHHVSGMEFFLYGDGLAVDTASGAFAAQACVYVEGEIKH